MRFRSLVVVVLTGCLSWSSHSPRVYPHGTVVFTLVLRDGLVMAADGLTTFVAEKGNGIAAPYRGAAEPKIAICGRRFLCGMAGVNPFPKGLGINYDFQKWITTFSVPQSSPEHFANIILLKARDTFRTFGSILLTDPFWRSKNAPQDLVDFQIAGYLGQKPQVCNVRIEVDHQREELRYHEPECFNPVWNTPNRTSFYHFPLSMGDSIEELLKGTTPEAQFAAEILPQSVDTAKALFPKFRPAMQELVGDAAAFVRVTERFNPGQVGGVTTIGVIEKGRPPAVFQFVN
jgi:hypothetical protein